MWVAMVFWCDYYYYYLAVFLFFSGKNLPSKKCLQFSVDLFMLCVLLRFIIFLFFLMLCADSRMRHAVCNVSAGPEEQSGHGPSDLPPSSAHTALNTINHTGRKQTGCSDRICLHYLTVCLVAKFKMSNECIYFFKNRISFIFKLIHITLSPSYRSEHPSQYIWGLHSYNQWQSYSWIPAASATAWNSG